MFLNIEDSIKVNGNICYTIIVALEWLAHKNGTLKSRDNTYEWKEL